MFKKKCPSCERKIEKKFPHCPWCGFSFRKKDFEENFGMLGNDDFVQDLQKQMNNEINLPGLNRMMASLMKQITNEMQKDMKINQFPKGISIQISTGMPGMPKINEDKKIKIEKEIASPKISENEAERRKSLPKKEAESTIRRLPDRIVYEINCPGAKSKEDIVISPLEKGIEIKIYAKDFCYTKTIPLKLEVIGYALKNEKMILNLKG